MEGGGGGWGEGWRGDALATSVHMGGHSLVATSFGEQFHCLPPASSANVVYVI